MDFNTLDRRKKKPASSPVRRWSLALCVIVFAVLFFPTAPTKKPNDESFVRAPNATAPPVVEEEVPALQESMTGTTARQNLASSEAALPPRANSPVQADKPLTAPKGFVSVTLHGGLTDIGRLEPGWDMRTLLDARMAFLDPRYSVEERDANQEQLAAGEADARTRRLAQLKKRLDAMRKAQGEERVAGDNGAMHQLAEAEQPDGSVTKGVINSGETVSMLLRDYLDASAVKQLEKVCEDVFPLNRLRAGRPYALTVWQGEFKRFEYEIDNERKLLVERTPGGFTAQDKRLEFEMYTVRAAGSITLSLFGAVERAGEGGELAMKLADIFGWEIDFLRDIRSGDSFKVLTEKRMRNGKRLGYGSVLAAEFVNQGRRYQAYLFHDEEGRPGYYDENGGSMRKAFLKAPLEFSRISSGFTWRRLHPILGKYRPHPGIDYAAPTGTPVKAVGSGTVIFKGWMSGGGNSIKLRHANSYETTYMHLSRFASGLGKGTKVQQGEVIGYVGSTGLATGPHLDFRMKKNGQYINPHKVENPQAEALPESLMTAFRERVRTLSAHLENDTFQPVLDLARDEAPEQQLSMATH
jgi:murein DD-endopeptidase MepM/ murein hydrolase activator NlpD